MVRAQPLPDDARFERPSDTWWFDEELLGQGIASIHDAERVLSQYRALPRGWGTGPETLAVVAEKEMLTTVGDAIQALRAAASQLP
jgi:hypothetical protein